MSGFYNAQNNICELLKDEEPRISPVVKELNVLFIEEQTKEARD